MWDKGVSSEIVRGISGESRIDPRSKESSWSDPHETLAFEIRGLDGSAPGQRVVFSHDGNGRDRNGLDLESGPIERTIRIAKVGLTACDCVENEMRGNPANRNMDIRPLNRKPGDKTGENASGQGRHRGDPERTSSLRPKRLSERPDPCQSDKGPLDLLEQRGRLGGRHDVVAAPLEQGQAGRFLQASDQPADGRLGDEERLGSARDAAGEHDRTECFDLTRTDFHKAPAQHNLKTCQPN